MRITPCKACKGKRLRPEALAVTVGDKNIAQITELSIIELKNYLDNLELTKNQLNIGRVVLKEIKARVHTSRSVLSISHFQDTRRVFQVVKHSVSDLQRR